MHTNQGAQALKGTACLEKVLSRLDKVKSAGPNKWKACCPAHNDKEPSLSITEASDGKLLLHCWAGCSATDITAAIGLTLSDLFPGEKQTRRGPSKSAITHEKAVYQVGLSMQMQGYRLNEQDQSRFDLAKQRLGVSQ